MESRILRLRFQRGEPMVSVSMEVLDALWLWFVSRDMRGLQCMHLSSTVRTYLVSTKKKLYLSGTSSQISKSKPLIAGNFAGVVVGVKGVSRRHGWDQ